MLKFLILVQNFLAEPISRDDRGATAVEYGLIVTLIAVVIIGVVTGNLEEVGWLKLQRGGIRPFFNFGSFSDTREKREDIFRYGVELARKLRGPNTSVCFIGDTPSDIRAAERLGMPVVAVATGIYSREDLARESPTVCVNTCSDLLTAA